MVFLLNWQWVKKELKILCLAWSSGNTVSCAFTRFQATINTIISTQVHSKKHSIFHIALICGVFASLCIDPEGFHLFSSEKIWTVRSHNSFSGRFRRDFKCFWDQRYSNNKINLKKRHDECAQAAISLQIFASVMKSKECCVPCAI